MPRAWSKTEAFDYFNTDMENVRWSWSGISRDQSKVVVVLWQDGVKRKEAHFVYWDDEDLGAEWRTRIGARRRSEHIQHAIDHCDSRFYAIIAIARDVTSEPREIERCFPQGNAVWLIDSFDYASGSFKAHAVID